jgi:hypothetical protein
MGPVGENGKNGTYLALLSRALTLGPVRGPIAWLFRRSPRLRNVFIRFRLWCALVAVAFAEASALLAIFGASLWVPSIEAAACFGGAAIFGYELGREYPASSTNHGGYPR